MQAEVAGAAGAADGADLLLSTALDTEAFYGRLRKARDLSQQAVEYLLTLPRCKRLLGTIQHPFAIYKHPHSR